MKTFVILNPNAGSAEDLDRLREAIDHLPDSHVEATEKEGDARAMAGQALREGAELIVAAGGDGTLNEVVNGLSEDFGRARLGLLPLGTGNDFARSIGVPADLEGSIAVLQEGRVRKIDVGCATIGEGSDSRYFLNMSAGGFSGRVSEMASEVKENWGPLSYLRSAIGVFPELEAFRAIITLNTTERLEMETYNLVVSNGRYVAAGIPVAPQAILDDGMLDVMIAPVTTIPQLAVLLPQVFLGRHADSDLLIFRSVTRIEIESDPPMAFNVDGELCGDGPARFEILPRALEIVVGSEAVAF